MRKPSKAERKPDEQLIQASNQAFLEEREHFGKSLVHALRVSRLVMGHYAGRYVEPPRRAWATVLFTRMCVTGTSIQRLLPQEVGNPERLDWDYSSVAALTRNLLEAHLFLFYFGIENVPEDEWLMRKWLIDLHDATARRRLYSGASKRDDPEGILKWVKDRLAGHPIFATLPERRRNHFLSGRYACFLNQDEIIDRMGQDRAQFREVYERLSSEAHSLPLAFHRMIKGGHGRGFENDRDKALMTIALWAASQSLELGIAQFRSIFPEVEFDGPSA